MYNNNVKRNNNSICIICRENEEMKWRENMRNNILNEETREKPEESSIISLYHIMKAMTAYQRHIISWNEIYNQYRREI